MLHCYADIIALVVAEWFWPEVTGNMPPPCAEISFLKTSDLKVVMAGGSKNDPNLLSNIYQLNLENWVSRNNHSTFA